MATLTENIETLKRTNISTYEEKVRNIIKGRRHIGEIFYSTVPITDASVHILDGSLLLDGGIYDSFITYIASLKDSYPNLFCTEEEWQSSVSTYGVCGKYVLTEGVSLRIPKITGFVEGIQLLVYVQVANSIPSDVELDIDNITTEVANKAMPSDKYVNVSFSHGTYYVAPSDGYLTIYGYGSASPISIILKDSNDSIVLLVNSVFGGVESDKSMGVTMPMRKGQISYMYYYNGTISVCRFVYAEGNKP